MPRQPPSRSPRCGRRATFCCRSPRSGPRTGQSGRSSAVPARSWRSRPHLTHAARRQGDVYRRHALLHMVRRDDRQRPGPSLYCCCGSVKRGDADMMRIIAAQLAERDQQIAALREARDTLCECIHDVEPDDFRACGACWLKLDSAILALLAPQAVDGFDSTAPRLRFDSAAATLAYLTADDDPAAAP